MIVLPYGDDYLMGGDGAGRDASRLVRLMARPPWPTMPVLVHGAGGERTDVVCGYLHSEDPLFDPRPASVPAGVRRHRARRAGSAMGAVEHRLRPGHDRHEPTPTEAVSTRLPELLLIEVLRAHLADAPAAEHGWIAALRDPVLAPAMGQLHGAPERPWTVAELASAVAVSRSVLDERFRSVLGRSPIRYLTEWRMHLAADLLATTDLTVATVARRVGYTSEEAFSRAFKRSHGSAPGSWRAAARDRAQ